MQGLATTAVKTLGCSDSRALLLKLRAHSGLRLYTSFQGYFELLWGLRPFQSYRLAQPLLRVLEGLRVKQYQHLELCPGALDPWKPREDGVALLQ